MERFEKPPHEREVPAHEVGEDALDGGAEGVVAAEERGFVGERGGGGVGGAVVGSAGAGGFEDVEGKTEALEGGG